MNLGLKGRIVLITGSSSGIGRSTAEAFGAESAHVVITFHNNRDNAERVAEEVTRAGGSSNVERLSLSDLESIRSAISATLDRFGRIDVLVNNAVDWLPETGYVGPAENMPPDQWQSLMRANIDGPFSAIQSVVPAMKANRWGRIVNVSSIAATDGFPGCAWYAAAKASLHGLTRTLAKELGPSGVLANVIMPGATSTDRILSSLHGRRIESMANALPLRRLPTPADVANVIVFLCSERNMTITGELIRVSGGRP